MSFVILAVASSGVVPGQAPEISASLVSAADIPVAMQSRPPAYWREAKMAMPVVNSAAVSQIRAIGKPHAQICRKRMYRARRSHRSVSP
jgi:hypothetical protein